MMIVAQSGRASHQRERFNSFLGYRSSAGSGHLVAGSNPASHQLNKYNKLN